MELKSKKWHFQIFYSELFWESPQIQTWRKIGSTAIPKEKRMDLSSQCMQHEPKRRGLWGKMTERAVVVLQVSASSPWTRPSAPLPCQQGKNAFSSREEGTCCWKDLAKTEKQRAENRQGSAGSPPGKQKGRGRQIWTNGASEQDPSGQKGRPPDGARIPLRSSHLTSLEEFQRKRVALGRLNELKMNYENILELDKQMMLLKKRNELGIVWAQLVLNREKEHLPGPKTCCGEEWPQTCSSDGRLTADTGRTVEAREA